LDRSTPFWRSCGPGDDLIYGGFLVYGGPDDDAIYGGSGDDAIYGDDGDDYLYAAGDGIADLLSGGGGSDLCIVGPEDLAHTSGCEVLYVQVTLIELFAAATERGARSGCPFPSVWEILRFSGVLSYLASIRLRFFRRFSGQNSRRPA
jgi:hypothetical protein